MKRLYQVGTISSLILGLFDSDKTLGDIKNKGNFNFIKGRSDEKRPKPYKKFTETVHKLENLVELRGVEAIMAGVYFPEYLRKINAPGFHFHFIGHDALLGGHLYDCCSEKLKIEICMIDKLELDLLTDVGKYHEIDMAQCNKKDISVVESEVREE
ncbi:acetolactate decarboxylase [Piscirickettsia salmonis]|uniref:acetolactate decarboxylase n=1 Tax=Piscirickettsia salmonis TaxID=1238 RepID=UPI0007C96C71|nr:Alpha-acetolactate decarboxylase precursor [Piscirickettsiaceae bacterium NZ-RLO1]